MKNGKCLPPFNALTKWNCVFKMLLYMLLRSLKVPANTLSKYKQSGHKFLAAALPGTIPKVGS
jgi:hypothetical protein